MKVITNTVASLVLASVSVTAAQAQHLTIEPGYSYSDTEREYRGKGNPNGEFTGKTEESSDGIQIIGGDHLKISDGEPSIFGLNIRDTIVVPGASTSIQFRHGRVDGTYNGETVRGGTDGMGAQVILPASFGRDLRDSDTGLILVGGAVEGEGRLGFGGNEHLSWKSVKEGGSNSPRVDAGFYINSSIEACGTAHVLGEAFNNSSGGKVDITPFVSICGSAAGGAGHNDVFDRLKDPRTTGNSVSWNAPAGVSFRILSGTPLSRDPASLVFRGGTSVSGNDGQKAGNNYTVEGRGSLAIDTAGISTVISAGAENRWNRDRVTRDGRSVDESELRAGVNVQIPLP